MPIEWLNLKFNRKPIHHINCRCQANQKPSPIWWSLKRPEFDWNFDEINWFNADNGCVRYENIAQMRYRSWCFWCYCSAGNETITMTYFLHNFSIHVGVQNVVRRWFSVMKWYLWSLTLGKYEWLSWKMGFEWVSTLMELHFWDAPRNFYAVDILHIHVIQCKFHISGYPNTNACVARYSLYNFLTNCTWFNLELSENIWIRCLYMS